jgi:hypothetical protein
MTREKVARLGDLFALGQRSLRIDQKTMMVGITRARIIVIIGATSYMLP